MVMSAHARKAVEAPKNFDQKKDGGQENTERTRMVISCERKTWPIPIDLRTNDIDCLSSTFDDDRSLYCPS